MKTFDYVTIDGEGERSEGTIKAANKAEALQKLSVEGRTVVSLGSPAKTGSPAMRIALLVLLFALVAGTATHLLTRKVENKSRAHVLVGAIRGGQLPVVKQQVGAQPELLNVPDSHSIYPLHEAVDIGHPEILAALVEAGADLEVKDEQGATPLLWAVDLQNSEFVEFLLQKGASSSQRDKEGNTPLHYAASGDIALVESLLSREAAISDTNSAGATALHLAAEEDAVEVATLLLESGADVNATDNQGRTALHWAALQGHTRIISALREKGADTSLRDKEGKTPQALAEEQEFESSAKLLGL